jgi:hypothetical protein
MNCRYHVGVQMERTHEVAPLVQDSNLGEDFRGRIALRCPVIVGGRRCSSVAVEYEEKKVSPMLCYECKKARVNCAGNLCTGCARAYRIKRLKKYNAVVRLERANSRRTRTAAV